MQNFGRGRIIDQCSGRSVESHICEDCGKEFELMTYDPLLEMYGREEPEIAWDEEAQEWICWVCSLIVEYDIYYHWDRASDPLLEDHDCFRFLYT